MRMISMVLALISAGAASQTTHRMLPTAAAAGVDLLILVTIYIAVRRAIRAYLGE